MKNRTLFTSSLWHFSSSPFEPVFLNHLWYFLIFSSPFVMAFPCLALLFSGCSSAPYTPCSIDNSTKRLLWSLMFFPVAGMFIICFSTCKVHYICSYKVIIFVLPFKEGCPASLLSWTLSTGTMSHLCLCTQHCGTRYLSQKLLINVSWINLIVLVFLSQLFQGNIGTSNFGTNLKQITICVKC